MAVVFPAPLAPGQELKLRFQLRGRGSVGGGQRFALRGRARHLVSEFRFEPGAVRNGVSLSVKLDACGDGKTNFARGQTRRRRRNRAENAAGGESFAMDLGAADSGSRLQPGQVRSGRGKTSRATFWWRRTARREWRNRFPKRSRRWLSSRIFPASTRRDRGTMRRWW